MKPPSAASAHSLRQILRQTSDVAATRVLGLLCAFATAVVLARALGPAERGHYGLAMVLIGLGVQLSTFGLHSANTFFVARDPAAKNVFFANSMVYSVVAGAIAGALLLIAMPILGGGFPSDRVLVLLLFASVPAGLYTVLAHGLLAGLGKVHVASRLELAHRVLFLGGLTGAAYAAGVTVSSALAVRLAALLVTGFLATLALAPQGVRAAKPRFATLKKAAGYGLKAHMACLAHFALLQTDLLVLGAYAPAEVCGRYAVALNMFEFVLVPAGALSAVLFPRLAAAGRAERRAMSRKAVVAALAFTAVVSGGVVFFAEPIVVTAFGREYAGAAPYVRILFLGAACHAGNSVLCQHLAALGFSPAVVATWALMVISKIGAAALAVSLYGAPVVAWLSAAGCAALFTASLLWVRRLESRGHGIGPPDGQR